MTDARALDGGLLMACVGDTSRPAKAANINRYCLALIDAQDYAEGFELAESGSGRIREDSSAVLHHASLPAHAGRILSGLLPSAGLGAALCVPPRQPILPARQRCVRRASLCRGLRRVDLCPADR